MSSELFKYIRIELQEADGTPIEVYDDSNLATVSVLDGSADSIRIVIYNPSVNVKRTKIRVGSLTDILGKDVYLYDIRYKMEMPVLVTQDIASGVVGSAAISTCLNCIISNPDFATDSHNPNSDYSSMQMGAFVGVLGTDYQYIRYDWGGIGYSGEDYSVNMVLSTEDLLSASVDLGTSLFDNGRISVVLAYTDATTDEFNFGTSGITISSFDGSGRFLVEIDADDSKTVENIEVRMYGGVLSVNRSLNIHNIYVSTSSAVLPLELIKFQVLSKTHNEVLLVWATSSEKGNKGFFIEYANQVDDFKEIGFVQSQEEDQYVQSYSFIHNIMSGDVHYYRLRQENQEGKVIYSAVVDLHKSRKSALVYYRPIKQELCIHLPTSSQTGYQISNLKGDILLYDRIIINDNPTNIDLSDLPFGYYVVTLFSDGQKISKRFFKD